MKYVKPQIKLNYSLHDSRVNKIEISERSLIFYFEEGFYKLGNPVQKIDARQCQLIVDGVNWDFSYIYILDSVDVSMNDNGSFQGVKYSIANYHKVMMTQKHKLDIVGETYGYNQANFSGFIMLDEKILEFKLEINHTGDLNYIINT